MAPVPDLYPIVIPPIEVKFGNKIFTCAGDGLLKDGHGYESNLKQFCPLTESKKTKGGNVAAKQSTPPNKPLAFWKAQCAFRNFVQNGSIEAIQNRLGGTDPKMDKELAKEQIRVNKKFRKLNDEARKKNWSTLTTDEDKASVDAERFLRDRFFRQSAKKPSAKGDAIILKTNDRLKIHQAAGPLDLFTESTEAPFNTDGSVPRIDRWIVVGTSKAAVSDKIRDINRATKQKASSMPRQSNLTTESQVSRAKREQNATSLKGSQASSKPPPKRKREDSPPLTFTPLLHTAQGSRPKKQTARKFVPSQKFVGSFPHPNTETFPTAPSSTPVAPRPRTKQTARKSVESHMWLEHASERFPEASSGFATTSPIPPQKRVKKETADPKSQVPWDVTGRWRIYCKSLEDEWPEDCRQGLSMTIHRAKAGQKHHLWATFDLGIITGVFRFMEPKPLITVPTTKPREGSGSYIKAECDSDGEEFEGGEVFDHIYDDVPFSSFRIKSLPSPSKPVAPFRWRGEETGEGEIQLLSDKHECSITFSGPGGVKCNGTFVCDYTKAAQFSGLKIGDATGSSFKTPQMEWKERSKGAHERARTSRWGGWHHSEITDDDEESDLDEEEEQESM